jgi:hypothetical protein
VLSAMSPNYPPHRLETSKPIRNTGSCSKQTVVLY